MVQPLGDQLLAGAALTDDEHRPVERRGAARPLDRIEKGGGLADQLGVAIHCQELGHFPTAWQGKSRPPKRLESDFGGFPRFLRFGTTLVRERPYRDRRKSNRFREAEMIVMSRI